jgi:hypothetical protein
MSFYLLIPMRNRAIKAAANVIGSASDRAGHPVAPGFPVILSKRSEAKDLPPSLDRLRDPSRA